MQIIYKPSCFSLRDFQAALSTKLREQPAAAAEPDTKKLGERLLLK